MIGKEMWLILINFFRPENLCLESGLNRGFLRTILPIKYAFHMVSEISYIKG